MPPSLLAWSGTHNLYLPYYVPYEDLTGKAAKGALPGYAQRITSIHYSNSDGGTNQRQTGCMMPW